MLTNAELTYYTRVPNLLAELVDELKKLNKALAENSEKKESTEGLCDDNDFIR